MKIVAVMAKKGGFCFGVKRAVDMAMSAAANGQDIYSLGPLIHNPAAVARLSSLGVRVAQSPKDIPQGASVVIRSHGVGKAVYEECTARGLNIIDATCPFVGRIHSLVEDCAKRRLPLVIIGEAAHPEVAGIAGWYEGECHIVDTAAQALALPHRQKFCVVVQTTAKRAHFEEILSAIKQRCDEAEVHDTICTSTRERQEEALRLAGECEAMVVVGGRNSANTRKLHELCSSVCGATYIIEDVGGLDTKRLSQYKKVGIASGASTPDWIIQEVYKVMSDIEVGAEQTKEELCPAMEPTEAPKAEEIPQETMKAGAELSFGELVEQSVRSIRPGQVVSGTVVQVSDTDVVVNIGYKHDGIIPKADFIGEGESDVNLTEKVKIGDTLEVQVKKVNDGEGNVLLSCKDLAVRKFWNQLVEEYEADKLFTATCKQVVKGGIISTIYGIRAFIPASQVDTGYVKDLEKFVGQEISVKVIEVDRQRHRVVASRKAVVEAEKKAHETELWDEVRSKEGLQVIGIVRRLTEFGAFVDIGGVDGLVHVTDISWGHVRDPKDVLHVGEEVTVLIMKVDEERHRVSLGIKQTKPKPWQLAPQKYIPGDIVEGKVVRIVPFGAFVELESGIDGLVHISQVADHRINAVEDVLQVGDVVAVRVLDVNPQEKRISLSIRAAQEGSDMMDEGGYDNAGNDGDMLYSTDNMDAIKAYNGESEGNR